MSCPVVFLLGDAAPPRREELERRAREALEGEPERFNRVEGVAGEGRVQALLGEARTPPMLGSRRVVVLRRLEEARPEEVEELLDYLASPNPSTLLLVEGRALPAKGGRRLSAALKKCGGELLRYEASAQDPVAWARQRAERAGVRLDPRVAASLVEMVGRDLSLLAGEVDKLVAYAGPGGVVDEEAVSRVSTLLAEAEVWALTDALVRRDADRALATAHRLLEAGEAPQKILGLVAWKLRQLVELQQLEREGRDPYREGLRMPGRQLRELRALLRRHPVRAERVLERLARANERMHGHRAGDRRVFEGLVLELLAGGPG